MKKFIFILICAMAALAIYQYNQPSHITELYKNSVSEGNLIATFQSDVDVFDLAYSNCDSFKGVINKSYPDEVYICVVKK